MTDGIEMLMDEAKRLVDLAAQFPNPLTKGMLLHAAADLYEHANLAKEIADIGTERS